MKLLAQQNNEWENALAGARAFFIGFIEGEVRGRQTLFPSTLDDLIPGDWMINVPGGA